MKRLAFLTFTIATLIAPIQVRAQQYVTFPQDFPPEAKVRHSNSHPGVRVYPSPIIPDRAEQAVREALRLNR